MDTLEVLLFSTSFVISVLFGDVETDKNRLILCDRQIKYRYRAYSIFASIKIFRGFSQKKEDLLPLFHKMLEGL